MIIDLKGRTAVITGGSKGLGLAMAKEFALNGAQVAIIGRDSATLKAASAEIHTHHGEARVLTVSADMSRASDVSRAYDEVMAAFGRIDIVVNNVGASAAKPFSEITDEEWQADLDLKFFSALRLTRLAWPQMAERKWGRVINTLAIAAKAPRAGSAPSSVTRAAGLALTKVLAGEGAPHNILVNALLVGLIESDQWERKARGSNRPVGDVVTELGRTVPLGRMGTGEEFANVAAFLASEAGSYITGTAINVDGGLSPIT
jgi:NAD(P)-dependent dehydrogenase (short-subunit alcohol dehydrogenase family)